VLYCVNPPGVTHEHAGTPDGDPLMGGGLALSVLLACLAAGVKPGYIRTVLLLMLPLSVILILTQGFFSGALVSEIERFFRIDDRVLKFMTVLLDKDVDPEKILADLAQETAACRQSTEQFIVCPL